MGIRGCSFFSLHTLLECYPKSGMKCFIPPVRKIQNVSYPRYGFQKMFHAPFSRKNGEIFHTRHF